ncbi:hypothetical protein B8A02_11265, partial [Staphylococcus aureus]
IDETLCTMWQGFNYEIDMNQEPGQRVMLDQIDLTKSYRVTMTDYCYRNYKNYLKNAIIHNVSSIIVKLNCSLTKSKCE